jgi:sulfur relay (sulfurtransferase) complex TusBCD TusD component (DsrE family)
MLCGIFRRRRDIFGSFSAYLCAELRAAVTLYLSSTFGTQPARNWTTTRFKVFLIGDAAGAAKAGQKVPQGCYNIEVMLRSMAKGGGEIGVCGACMDARGVTDADLSDAVHRSSLDQLTDCSDIGR